MSPLFEELRADVKAVREAVTRLEERTSVVTPMQAALAEHEVADAKLHGALQESVMRLWWFAGGALALAGIALGAVLTRLLA